MTKEEYDKYCSAVQSFFAGEGVNCLTSDHEKNGEAFFSWSPCDCCKRPLGGNREIATGYNPATPEVQEYEVCADCLYFVEYGQLDDMTMLSLEETA